MTDLLKPCRTSPIKSALTLATSALLVALLTACATPQREAQRLSSLGQHESALGILIKAHANTSTDVALHAAYLKEREAVIVQGLAQADVARRTGHADDVRAAMERIEAIAPRDPRVAWLRDAMGRTERHKRLMAEAQSAFDQQQWSQAETVARGVLEEDPGNAQARALLTRVSERQAVQAREEPMLAAGKKTVSLEFRDASLRNVFETLAQAGNVNFVFDKDVRADGKVTLVLRNTSVDEAMRIILATQQLDRKLLNETTVLIYQNNAQKQREFQEMVTRSFYLVNADAKQAQTLVRTMTKTKDLHVDERLNLLVVRDTPEVIRMVERLIESIDLPEAEVMLEVEVMEVSANLLRELGLSWPTTLSYGLIPQSTTTSGAGSYISSDMRGSLRAYIGNPLVTARLNGTSGSTNLLANPRIRARNREKAHVQLGNKLPVFTTTTTGAGSVAGFIASSVTYLDVGLKLDVEPSVLPDNDIVLKVALEVSSVASQVTGPDGSIAYNVGTRQTSTSLRLKDGETEVLAGLIQDDDRKTTSGIPGLSELPVLGSLFGIRSDSHGKTEIVMLITPHIVRNVSLPPVAAASQRSGTEAQPGASSLQLRGSAAQVRISPSEVRESDARTSPSGSAPAPDEPPVGRVEQAPAAAASLVASLGGPQDAVAGSTIQITINNPATQTLNAELAFDPDVLQPVNVGPQPGRVAVQVPANQSQAVGFVVKPTIRDGSSTLSLSTGGSLTVRLHPPSTVAVPATAKP